MEVEIRTVAPETGHDAIAHRRAIAVTGQFVELILWLLQIVVVPAFRGVARPLRIATGTLRRRGSIIAPWAFVSFAGGPRKTGDDRMFVHDSAPGLASPIASVTWTYNRLRRTVCRIPPLRK